MTTSHGLRFKVLFFVAVMVALTRLGPLGIWGGQPTDSASFKDYFQNAVVASRSPKEDPDVKKVGRLAVVSICTDDSPFANNTKRLNQAYCRLHGCDYIRVPCPGKGEIDRVNVVLEILKQANATSDTHRQYEYVMWMDCDAAFVNPLVSIQDQVLSHFDPEKQVGMLLSKHADFQVQQNHCRDIDNITEPCDINSGVFVVRQSQAGIAALQVLRIILATRNNQAGFDRFAIRQGKLKRQGRNASVKALFAEVMNRHVPPLGFIATNESLWTAAEFRELQVWSDLPTLIIHPYGQFHLRTDYFECAVKVLLVPLDGADGGNDGDVYIYHNDSASKYTDIAIDKCAQVFEN